MDSSNFVGNLRTAQNNLGALSQRNTQAPATQAKQSSGGDWGKYLSSIPSKQNTIFGYAPWEGGGFGVNRWEKSMNKKAVDQYKGKYSKSEAAAVITGDIADKIFDNMTKVGEKESASFITKTVDEYLDSKYGGANSDRAKLGPSGAAFDPTMERIKQSAQNSKEGETITLTAVDTSEGPVGAPQEGPGTVGYDTQEDIYEYTYAPGDNFGNVLIKMGLSDGRNLWGPNGDVAYYTQQLNNQGIYGNIPIGTKIRLRKRA